MHLKQENHKGVDLREFLTRPLVAHLATVSADGPRETPVWFLWEDGAMWLIGDRKNDSFPRRIEGDSRWDIGIVDFNKESGFMQHIGLRGRANIEPLELERAKRLLRRYLGEDQANWPPRYLHVLENPDSLFVRFEPEIAVARDQSYKVAGWSILSGHKKNYLSRAGDFSKYWSGLPLKIFNFGSK
jgi:hypothetical protein